MSNRNGGIFGRTEHAILEPLLPPDDDRAAATAQGGVSPGARAQFAAWYVSGRDTLRLLQRGDSLFYRYAANAEMRTRAGGDSAILVLDPTGQPVQQFRLVRGMKTRNYYLHDRLSAFRRLP